MRIVEMRKLKLTYKHEYVTNSDKNFDQTIKMEYDCKI